MGSSDEFETSVKRHAAEEKFREQKSSVDWEERKRWWLAKINDLYQDFRVWLNPLLAEDTIGLSFSEKVVSEEMLGTYNVQEAIIKLGLETLKFTPVGSVIIGGYGRIDVEGPEGIAMLVLYSEVLNGTAEERRAGAKWHISHPKNRADLQLLTQKSFQQLFSDLFGIK